MNDRYQTAEWLELSGLPEKLNQVRSGGWAVVKKLIELDCRHNRVPDAIEVTLGELAERCGISWEKVSKIIEALRRRKVITCFLPDNPDEPGLFQVRVPIETPRPAEEVAQRVTDPHLRDTSCYRYLKKSDETAADEKKVQKIIDLYLNTLSQKVNSFIVEEIEILAQRFPMDKIEREIRRASRHDIRSIGWVAKELIRDAAQSDKKPRKSRK